MGLNERGVTLPLLIERENREFTRDQSSYLYPLFDRAKIGARIENEFSLRNELEQSGSIAFFADRAIGDDIFTIPPTLEALYRLFSAHPELTKPVTVYTHFPEIFAGFSKKYPFTIISKLPKDYSVRDLQATLPKKGDKPVFVFSGSGIYEDKEYLDALRQNNPGRISTIAHVDVHRYSEDVNPWDMPNGKSLETAGTRLARFMEVLLGEKLFEDPTVVDTLNYPIADGIQDRGTQVAQALGIKKDTNLYMLLQAGSVYHKQMSHQQIINILTKRAEYCNQHDKNATILFIEDPAQKNTSNQNELGKKLFELRNQYPNLKFTSISLHDLFALFSTHHNYLDLISVLGADSGPTHLASAMGVLSGIVYTIASPKLWIHDRSNTYSYATPEAEFCDILDKPLHMLAWSDALAVEYIDDFVKVSMRKFPKLSREYILNYIRKTTPPDQPLHRITGVMLAIEFVLQKLGETNPRFEIFTSATLGMKAFMDGTWLSDFWTEIITDYTHPQHISE